MNNIDKIFSKLKESEFEAPDIWNKLEAQLGSTPKSNINNNLDKAVAAKSIIKNTILKTIGLVAGVGIIGVGAYLVIDSISKKDSKEKIVKTQIQNPEINKEYIKEDSEKTITFEEAKQINNQNTKKEDITTTFKVNDETSIVLESSNYSIKKINTSQSYPSEIKIDYIQEDSSTNNEKASLPSSGIPEFRTSNVVTPNGDGINDVFVIKDVDKYPDNCLIIYDRNGKSIYKCRGYQNNFNAINIPLGTYFYKFEYNVLGKKETKSGSITVM